MSKASLHTCVVVCDKLLISSTLPKCFAKFKKAFRDSVFKKNSPHPNIIVQKTFHFH